MWLLSVTGQPTLRNEQARSAEVAPEPGANGLKGWAGPRDSIPILPAMSTAMAAAMGTAASAAPSTTVRATTARST